MQGFQVTITEKGGKPEVETFEQNEVTIGRVQGNDIVLPKGNISKRHSRIVLRDGKFIIVDLKSTNGTYVNGKRINSPQVLKDVDKIYIGDFTLTVESSADAEAAPKPAPEPEPEIDADLDIDGPGIDELEDALAEDDDLFGPDDDEDDVDLDDGLDDALDQADQAFEAPTPPPPEPEPKAKAKKKAKAKPKAKPKAKKKPKAANGAAAPHIELPAQAVLTARAAVFKAVKSALVKDGKLPEAEDENKAAAAAEKTIEHLEKKNALGGADTAGWKDQIAAEICGLGPLAALLEDDDVTEIFVNGPHYVFVRRDGALEPEPVIFSSDDAVALVVSRVMESAGVPFDSDNPVAEGRLADGTRVNAVHQTASVKGPIVTLSRSSTRNASLEDLVDEDVLSEGMAEFLETCVRARRSIVVCGGAGAGTGTLLGALGAQIPASERIVCVEPVSQLALPQPHVAALEARSISKMRDLVSNALRMRPDRVLVHEMAGAEALELMLAMAGSQDGILVSTYASSSRDCLDRIETMMLMAGQELPTRVVREQIASSVDVVVCMTRFADGSFKVTEIVEVTGTEVDLVTTQDLFNFKRDDFDADGGAVGRFVAKGNPPRFYEELKNQGEDLNMAIFREGM